MSVMEGNVAGLEFCLTVTEVLESHMFRRYVIETVPFGGTAKSVMH